MNAHAKVKIGHSVCPHDCPSTCALDVELLDGNRIGRVHGAKDNDYTAGVICAKVARYAERIHHPDRLMHPLRRKGAKGSGQFERISWDDALDITAEAMLAAERRHGPEAVWPYYYAGTMGLVMRDGINRLRHAKRYSVMYATICTTHGVDRLHRRHRQAGRTRSARDGEVGHGGDLGDEPGQHPGQRDDPCRPRPQGARRQDRRHRHLPERHHAAGRPGAVRAAGHGWRARLRRHACAVPRRPCQLAVHGAVHRLPARAGSASARQDAGMGERDHGADGRRDRNLREDGRHHAQDLFPAGLRLFAPAQRRPQHARGAVHPVGDGGVAARGRRRLPQQRRHLSLEQVADRRSRRGRPEGARVRSMSHRPGVAGRPGRSQGRTTGDRALHPEHEPGAGGARAAQGESRVRARGSVHLRARAVHDGDRENGRHGAARHHVPGAR